MTKKSKIIGKTYSKAQHRNSEGDEGINNHLLDLATRANKNQFSEILNDCEQGAIAQLKSSGLPHTPIVYKLVIDGKEVWQMQKPEEDKIEDCNRLFYYLTVTLKIKQDHINAIAGSIIERVYDIKSGCEDKLTQIFYLGKESLLIQHYARTGYSQAKRAKQKRDMLEPYMKKLAKMEGSAKEMWPVLFGMLDSDQMSPVENSSGERYDYMCDITGKKGFITFGTFEKKLSTERNQ